MIFPAYFLVEPKKKNNKSIKPRGWSGVQTSKLDWLLVWGQILVCTNLEIFKFFGPPLSCSISWLLLPLICRAGALFGEAEAGASRREAGRRLGGATWGVDCNDAHLQPEVLWNFSIDCIQKYINIIQVNHEVYLQIRINVNQTMNPVCGPKSENIIN